MARVAKETEGAEPAPKRVEMQNAVGWTANVLEADVATWEAAGWSRVGKEAGNK